MNATKHVARRITKPATEVHGVCRWVGGAPSPARLAAGGALLLIAPAGKEPSFYFVQTHKDNEKAVGYRLTKIDAPEKTASYDVEATPHGLRCDCPDATYRDRECKHAAALKAALARLTSTPSTPARTETRTMKDCPKLLNARQAAGLLTELLAVIGIGPVTERDWIDAAFSNAGTRPLKPAATLFDERRIEDAGDESDPLNALWLESQARIDYWFQADVIDWLRGLLLRRRPA
jgi:hypothetical protein